ncbi:MAG: hypothetical protein C0606_17805 [Hyphomicrobiales bacterium]|nr:MAG: hypothetical protein C0606_17805 [Hyphomicrobiales bacterium]
MGFSEGIKKRLMVDSARHCCVCHRYKGVGVEVHHIHPKADGGADTYENGIVLCFDCHCAAGHYNLNHPRGTKFSPDELRGHKERWFDHVKHHSLDSMSDEDVPNVICRYFLTADREEVSKILGRDSGAAFSLKYLLRTPRLKTQFDQLANAYGGRAQDQETDGYGNEFFETRAQLIEKYPEFEGRQNAQVSQRIADDEKLSDPFTAILLQLGAKLEDVASMSLFYEACGGSGWGVDFHTRKPYFVFAQIMSLNDEPVSVTSINNQPFKNNALCQKDAFDMSEVRDLFNINNLVLLKNESIGIFLGAMAGPIDYNPTSYQFETGPSIGEDYHGDTIVRTVLNAEGVASDFSTVGQLYIPRTATVHLHGRDREIAFEEFRPDTLFLISREWLCGSCPHVFGLDKETGKIHFLRTLFDNVGPDEIEEVINCEGYSKLIIAEFDNEVTHIGSVSLDGVQVYRDRKLVYGDAIELDVSGACTFSISGHYRAEIGQPANGVHRRQKLSKYRAYERELRLGFIEAEKVGV